MDCEQKKYLERITLMLHPKTSNEIPREMQSLKFHWLYMREDCFKKNKLLKGQLFNTTK